MNHIVSLTDDFKFNLITIEQLCELHEN